MNYYAKRAKSKCRECKNGESGHHDPYKPRCKDFNKFLKRLEIIKNITWFMNKRWWKQIAKVKDLRHGIMRMFKISTMMEGPERAIVLEVAEITTKVMRLEQS